MFHEISQGSQGADKLACEDNKTFKGLVLNTGKNKDVPTSKQYQFYFLKMHIKEMHLFYKVILNSLKRKNSLNIGLLQRKHIQEKVRFAGKKRCIRTK